VVGAEYDGRQEALNGGGSLA